ncbi:FGGY-family carbohydrate kinase [Limnothrix sp. FACHB-1083]|uniref:FGGY-family carbohydrate kinase n=2 Tax=unclassified Limnothrix TaxID=2632864 RepID=UPI001F550575|nr:FGGY-family carbohydrate kinase [Limnothrix sp. FACHB-1083]
MMGQDWGLDEQWANQLAMGIDFGTSGARAMVVDRQGAVVAQAQVSASGTGSGSAADWLAQLTALLADLPRSVRQQTGAIAINGTSGTVLLCDRQGHPLTDPLAYDDDRGQSVLPQIAAIAPADHVTHSATSSLAKLLWWRATQYGGQWPTVDPPQLLHQADWLGAQLHGQFGITDYHNALKLGGDPIRQTYPQWLRRLDIGPSLPKIAQPGQAIGTILPLWADRWDFPIDCQICTGTTDSIAAFLASGVQEPGQAVTSLGSTLAIKLLSEQPVADRAHGVYSHFLGRSLMARLAMAPLAPGSGNTTASPPSVDRWLVGGASNAGGRVLRHFFSDQELQRLTAQIDPQQPSPLDYYPLLEPGDRFPICDPHLPPRLTPRPADPAAFLQGILEGLARIESQGYQLLQQLGASPLQLVQTAGGGAKNDVWTAIRSRHLGCPVRSAKQTEAAYGTAWLAWAGLLGPT